MSVSVDDHRYAGRRREIHGDVAERMRETPSVGASVRSLFPSSRLLGRVALGGLVAGSGFMASPAFAGAETVNETTDDDLDIETGDDPDDVTIVGDGDNTVVTNGGDDDVDIQGNGNNTVDTGEGHDEVEIIGDGSNDVDGGAGNEEVLIEGDGDNTVDGGDGNDELVIVGDGNNTVDGGAGSDFVVVDGQGENTIEGGAGSDFVAVDGQGENTIEGGAGEDFIAGGNGNDTIDAGDDNDLAQGDQWVSGEEKEDTGDDVVSGGNGNDAVFGDSDDSASQCSPLEAGLFELVDCGDDTVSGDDGNDWVEGNLGDDDVDGGTGDDLVIGDDLLHYLYEEFGFEGSYEVMFDLLDEEFGELTPEDEAMIIEFLESAGFTTAGGNDVVQGGDGADIVAGMGGHDVVCGDGDDLAVLGGGGTDVPCAAFEETVDASSGSATGDLSTDMRDLDDENLELDGDGAHNPYEFVIDATLLSSNGDIDTYKTAKGTVHLNRVTGAFTYEADPGATGTEDISYTVRRVVVECADYTGTEADGAYQPGCQDGPVLLAADIVDVEGTDYLYSLWRVFGVFLGDPVVPVDPTDPVDPVDPVVPVEATDATPAELPRTGTDTDDLAMAGLAMLALGGLATIESRRRLRAHAG